MNKTCNRCGKELTPKGVCPPCHRTAQKKRRRQINRAYVAWFLQSSKCYDCGCNDWRVLQFDHVRDKYKEISLLMRDGYSLDTIIKEIDKCVVRCANCHLLVTSQRAGFWRTSLDIPVYLDEVEDEYE